MHEPMDYTPPSSIRSTEPVEIDETKDVGAISIALCSKPISLILSLQHFIKLVQNDKLGRTCNAHLAIADSFSPSDFQCIELASLASQAVDFPKTGVAVDQSQLPVIEEYPDFMGKVRIRCKPWDLGSNEYAPRSIKRYVLSKNNP